MKVSINQKEFYMDGIEKDNLDLVKSKIKKDWDMCFVCGGVEGSGKSTKVFQVAYYVSNGRFNLDHVCFNVEDFKEKILRPNFLLQGDALVLDESFVLNSRASMTEMTRQFLAIMSECRQKNLFLFIIIPNFFDLDKNLSLWRSRGLYYVYHDQMNRGYFKFYGYEKKKKLYILGKKFYDYSCVRPDFSGRFTKFMPFDSEEYKRRKLKAFELRDRNKVKDSYLAQRNVCFKFMSEEGMSHKRIAQMMTKRGFKLSQQGVSKAISTTDNQPLINNKLIVKEISDSGSEAGARSIK